MKWRWRAFVLPTVAMLWSGLPAAFALYVIALIVTGSTFGRGDAAYISKAAPFVLTGCLVAMGVGILAMPRFTVRILLCMAGVASLCFVAAAAKFWHYDCVITHGGFRSGNPSCAIFTPINVGAAVYAIYVAVFLVWAWRASNMPATASADNAQQRKFTIRIVGWIVWAAPLLAVFVPAAVLFAVFATFWSSNSIALTIFAFLSPVLLIGTIVAIALASFFPPRIAGCIFLIGGTVAGCGWTTELLLIRNVRCHSARFYLPGRETFSCGYFSDVNIGLVAYAIGLIVIAILTWRSKPVSAVSPR